MDRDWREERRAEQKIPDFREEVEIQVAEEGERKEEGKRRDEN